MKPVYPPTTLLWGGYNKIMTKLSGYLQRMLEYEYYIQQRLRLTQTFSFKNYGQKKRNNIHMLYTELLLIIRATDHKKNYKRFLKY